MLGKMHLTTKLRCEWIHKNSIESCCGHPGIDEQSSNTKESKFELKRQQQPQKKLQTQHQQQHQQPDDEHFTFAAPMGISQHKSLVLLMEDCTWLIWFANQNNWSRYGIFERRSKQGCMIFALEVLSDMTYSTHPLVTRYHLEQNSAGSSLHACCCREPKWSCNPQSTASRTCHLRNMQFNQRLAVHRQAHTSVTNLKTGRIK